MSEEKREGSPAEMLMDALVTKMEAMDNTIQQLQAENTLIKQHMANPNGLLKKMGFVSVRTPLAEDVMPDIFRGGGDDILKSVEEGEAYVPQTNEDFHAMNWNDIHALADSAKDAGHVGNVNAME